MQTVPDSAPLREAERLADRTGKPVEWRGQTVYPDYRPGHTTIAEINARQGR